MNFKWDICLVTRDVSRKMELSDECFHSMKVLVP